MENIQEVIAALNKQYETVNARLTAIAAEETKTVVQYREQRTKVQAEAGQLARALAAFGVKVAGVTVTSSDGTRKPMSAQARENIRLGLQKAREKKLAGVGSPAPAQDAPAPAERKSGAVSDAVSPAKKSAAKKAVGSRG